MLVGHREEPVIKVPIPGIFVMFFRSETVSYGSIFQVIKTEKTVKAGAKWLDRSYHSTKTIAC